MADPAELEARIVALEAEVARLHAREGVLATFNRYLYALDTSIGDSILDAYADDCVLDVVNFPPDGVDMHYEGRSEIAELFVPYADRPSLIGGGHNATNVAVAVADDATTASLSAYFTTTGLRGIQGGRYEGTLRLDPDGRWRFATLSIVSAWGWRADVDTVSDPVPVERSMFDGGPATGL